MYLSLDRLPNVTRDRYGNLILKVEGYGLRSRIKYVSTLNNSELTGTALSELLDWLRWGSATSVLWECTLPELIAIIEKWLTANPGAPRQLFNPFFTKEVDWNQLWIERGEKTSIQIKHRCRCNITHQEFNLLQCQNCWQKWYEMEIVAVGPRGEGSYDLILNGAAGESVSTAVWTNRNWLFLSPLEFEQKFDDCQDIYALSHHKWLDE